MNFEFLKITAPAVFTRDLNHGPLDLKASALPLCQAGTCMSKVGTIGSMPPAGPIFLNIFFIFYLFIYPEESCYMMNGFLYLQPLVLHFHSII